MKKITIVYGTETGNAEYLATEFVKKAKKLEINVTALDIENYSFDDLPREEYLFVIMSTHGDGNPPQNAEKFYEFIHQCNLQLSGLKYGVLALGDSDYPLFCQAGEDVDKQLYKLGANRVIPLQKCDVEYDTDADEWFSKIIALL